MFQYYSQCGILPTFCNLQTEIDFEKHIAYRTDLLKNKLYLPPRFFRDLRLISFGCDSGENELVFAYWGAKLTLVEPNENSWPTLHAYFKKFNLENQIKCPIHNMSLEKYATSTFSDSHYDFIDCEGMIQTVDKDIWQSTFYRCLNPGGMLLISYPERYGMGMDLLHKEIYQKASKLAPTIAAADLFKTKWYLIPHSRTFEAWRMDMLENPFVDEAHTYETNTLDRQMTVRGFSLYSSWPARKHCGQAYWHKLTPDMSGVQALYVENTLRPLVSPETETVEAIRSLIDLGAPVEKLVAFCNTDFNFLHTWGVPYNFSVYERGN